MKFDLERIKSLEDADQRWFALGVLTFCEQFKIESQKVLVIEAGIQKSTMSALCNGNPLGFPGPMARKKIATVFKKEVFDIVKKGRETEEGKYSLNVADERGFYKGREIDSEQDEIPSKKEPAAHETVKGDDQSGLPFPHYLEVMKLPIQYRAMAIKRVAAEAHGFKNWLESTGDRMLHGDAPSPLEQRYLDGEITEEDIYKEYKEFFKGLEERTLEEFKRRGLL